MALKAKKKASVPPKVKTKAKVLVAKKVLKGVHSHEKKIHMSPSLWWPEMWHLWQPRYPWNRALWRHKLDHYAVKFP